jgi:hypothetical protein
MQIRVRRGEYDVFREAAEAAGLDLSGWARQRLRMAAKRDLRTTRDDPKYK